MERETKVSSQAELDDAIKRGLMPVLTGDGYFEVLGSSQVRAFGSSQVHATGSSQVRAFGSSQVRAFGSSQVHAFDSSQVHAFDSSQVRAFGSSQVHATDSSQVRAFDSSQVHATGSSQVHATQFVAVTKAARHGGTIVGGVLVAIPKITAAAEWCEFYGVEVIDGVATLFKALDDQFKSGHGFSYTPGSVPLAPDWDDGKAECGGGLHFSPRPFMATVFMSEAKRFVACPVKLSDISVHPDGVMPEKVKARGCCGPVYECDIDGVAIGETKDMSAPPVPAP